jgi:putative flavoprotein involved in K+ transport
MAADSFPGRRLKNARLGESGVTLVSRLAGADATAASFADGKVAKVRCVVWAVGYREDSGWSRSPEAKNPHGSFVQSRGISSVPGLYFVGKKWQWTGGSALLLGVGADARYVAADIAMLMNHAAQRHH